MKKQILFTPIGEMIAIGDEECVYLLDFVDRVDLRERLDRFGNITFGKSAPLVSIEEELNAYFEKKLKVFKTPVAFLGTSFQKRAWEGLQTISFGKVWSYKEQAIAIGHPKAHRAVANANRANLLSVIVPCHRVITSSNRLCGYGGGVDRKRWLLNHEGASSLFI